MADLMAATAFATSNWIIFCSIIFLVLKCFFLFTCKAAFLRVLPIAAEPHCHHCRFQSFGREGFSLSPNMWKKHDCLSVGLFPSAHAQLLRPPVAVIQSSRSVPPAARARPFYSAPLLSFVFFLFIPLNVYSMFQNNPAASFVTPCESDYSLFLKLSQITLYRALRYRQCFRHLLSGGIRVFFDGGEYKQLAFCWFLFRQVSAFYTDIYTDNYTDNSAKKQPPHSS